MKREMGRENKEDRKGIRRKEREEKEKWLMG